MLYRLILLPLSCIIILLHEGLLESQEQFFGKNDLLRSPHCRLCDLLVPLGEEDECCGSTYLFNLPFEFNFPLKTLRTSCISHCTLHFVTLTLSKIVQIEKPKFKPPTASITKNDIFAPFSLKHSLLYVGFYFFIYKKSKQLIKSYFVNLFC